MSDNEDIFGENQPTLSTESTEDKLFGEESSTTEVSLNDDEASEPISSPVSNPSPVLENSKDQVIKIFFTFKGIKVEKFRQTFELLTWPCSCLQLCICCR